MSQETLVCGKEGVRPKIQTRNCAFVIKRGKTIQWYKVRFAQCVYDMASMVSIYTQTERTIAQSNIGIGSLPDRVYIVWLLVFVRRRWRRWPEIEFRHIFAVQSFRVSPALLSTTVFVREKDKDRMSISIMHNMLRIERLNSVWPPRVRLIK